MIKASEQAADFGPPPSSTVQEAIALAQSGDFKAAELRMLTAIEARPDDPLAWVTLAGIRGRAGDQRGEFDAIERALAIDPYYLPGLLLKGNWYEGQGNSKLAASMYRYALQVTPAEPYWPEQLKAELTHAKHYVGHYARGLSRHLSERLAHLRADLERGDAERWDEAVSIRARLTEPYLSNSNQLYIPRLPAIPFFEREQFPFLDEFERRTEAIREELIHALAEREDGFAPYIAYRPGEPVNQWAHLNHSSDWNAFHLYKGGEPVEENLASCPETRALLESQPLCTLSGLCPNVFFSALKPHTRIPPHYGESNARVIAHLPLIVPGNCGIRVGFETREWEVGKALVFDDTLEHEAWNESDELRVIMIFDLWNPLLSEKDRALASALAEATRGFSGS